MFVFAASASAQQTEGPFVVHEWGTFTSVAGEDGISLEWRPLNGPSDLPSFVYNMETLQAGLRLRDEVRFSKSSSATIRMETPVVYFYSDRERDVSLQVGFPDGHITEWYPRVASHTGSRVDWGTFKILPNDKTPLLTESDPSHYYPARNVDAATVRVCSDRGYEHEKFLFYRGVGDFSLPLSVKLRGDRVDLAMPAGQRIGEVVVFERKGDEIGFVYGDHKGRRASVARPTLDGDLDGVLARLHKMLVAKGLYAKEATAMIDTWRDTWFEDGLRVFTLLDSKETEGVLPMTIEPTPTELVRVLVGRVEVITPELEHAIHAQLLQALHSPKARQEAILDKLHKTQGRFLEPAVARILRSIPDPAQRDKIMALVTPVAVP